MRRDTKHYGDADRVLHELNRFHFDSRDAMHNAGYHGFKRMHDYEGRETDRIRSKLRRHVRDKYRTRMEDTGHPMQHMYQNNTTMPYAPRDIKEHINHFDSKLEKWLEEMAEISKKHLEIHGKECKILKRIYKMLEYFYKKTERWNQKINSFAGSPEVLHQIDSKMHDKYKEHMSATEGRRGVPGSGRGRGRSRRRRRYSNGRFAPRSLGFAYPETNHDDDDDDDY